MMPSLDEIEIHEPYRTFLPRLGAGIIDGLLFVPLWWVSDLVYRDGSPTVLVVVWFVLSSFLFLAYSIGMRATARLSASA